MKGARSPQQASTGRARTISRAGASRPKLKKWQLLMLFALLRKVQTMTLTISWRSDLHFRRLSLSTLATPHGDTAERAE